MSVYGFRFYFTPLTGVLFAFPSRYLFTIGSRLVFSLGSWSTRILTGFLVPRHTQDTAMSQYVSDTRLSRSMTLLPRSFSYTLIYCLLNIAVLQPRSKRFGLLPVRSPLLGESLLISVPELLRWFTSLSMTSLAYFIQLPGWCITPDYSIRTSRGHRICAPYPGFSQLITSFFVLRLLGIRHKPVFA